ncbi:MAG: hypothetical protein EOP87_07285 [Verrucomicrobiaceae bacterium]|nr:MAG: hypothetical protein EOP87_07285 [Verrucomicrobiaceae bacterium]
MTTDLKKPSSMKAGNLFLILSAALFSTAAAVVVHTEEFNPTFDTNPKSFSTVQWQAHRGATAVDVSGVTTSPYIITNSTGFGGVAGIGARTASGDIGIAWTEEFSPVLLTDLVSISFRSNNNLTTDLSRIAVGIDVGGTVQWFASAATYGRDSATVGTSGNFGTNGELESLTFTTVASAWRLLTFTPGTSLVLGGAAVSHLPAGMLVGAGVLTESNAETLRFDRFEIEAVPEPSSLAAGMLALLIPLGRRRRRDA